MGKTRPESLTKKQEECIQVLKCVRIKVKKREKKKTTTLEAEKIKQEEAEEGAKKVVIPPPSLAAAMKKRNPPKRPTITTERIKALIHYIVEDKLEVSDAADKAEMSLAPAREYYRMYTDDPEHKIPLPRKRQSNSGGLRVTQEQVNTLIDSIENHGMKIQAAADKADMKIHTAKRYYEKYMHDPNKNIPVPGYDGIAPTKARLYDKVKTLIGYIVDDNMSLYTASLKVNMCPKTAKKYYEKYLEDPEHKIPVPQAADNKANASSKGPSYEQVKELIGYIVDDSMSVFAAAKQVNMSVETGRRYYQKYLADPLHNIPDPTIRRPTHDKCTQEQIEVLIHGIERDKLSISAATAKAGMGVNTGSMYYHMYLEERKMPKPKDRYRGRPTEEQYKQFHQYVVEDKMSVRRAATKAKMGLSWGKNYYEQNLKDL